MWFLRQYVHYIYFKFLLQSNFRLGILSLDRENCNTPFPFPNCQTLYNIKILNKTIFILNSNLTQQQLCWLEEGKGLVQTVFVCFPAHTKHILQNSFSQQIGGKYCVDLDSVHLSGLSNGGMFAYYAASRSTPGSNNTILDTRISVRSSFVTLRGHLPP